MQGRLSHESRRFVPLRARHCALREIHVSSLLVRPKYVQVIHSEEDESLFRVTLSSRSSPQAIIVNRPMHQEVGHTAWP